MDNPEVLIVPLSGDTIGNKHHSLLIFYLDKVPS